MNPIVAVDDRPWLVKNVPIITFFSRTLMVFIFMLLSNWAVLSNIEYFVKPLPNGTQQGVTLFEMLGAVLYVPALASVVMWVYLLLIHLFFRDTLDLDAHSGVYIADWRAL